MSKQTLQTRPPILGVTLFFLISNFYSYFYMVRSQLTLRLFLDSFFVKSNNNFEPYKWKIFLKYGKYKIRVNKIVPTLLGISWIAQADSPGCPYIIDVKKRSLLYWEFIHDRMKTLAVGFAFIQRDLDWASWRRRIRDDVCSWAWVKSKLVGSWAESV